MKQLVLILLAATLLASCYSKKLTDASPQENFAVREITIAQADSLRNNYVNKPSLKKYFRRGMYLPVKVLDALRTEEGINGIMVYYGYTSEFKSPVFVLIGTKTILGYKNQFADKAYMVYYPCPTHCN